MKANKPSGSDAVPAPLNVAKRSGEMQNGTLDAGLGHQRTASGNPSPVASQPLESSRRTSVSRKPLASIPSATTADALSGNAHRESLSTKQQNRTSVDKPLPTRPAAEAAAVEDIAQSKHLPSHSKYLVKDAPNAPSLAGIVDLKSTVDTTVNSTWAPGK